MTAPHQQRVVAERAELHERIVRLNAFIDTAMFAAVDAAERGRLRRQLGWMSGYRAVLDERIAAFDKEVE